MYSATVHTLGFTFDRNRNALVFTGQLENGFAFEVAFPIGHVALTFHREATALGYCGEPLMGDVETVDGFLGAVEMMHQRETGVELGWFGSRLIKKATHAVTSVANTVNKALPKPLSKVAQAYVSTVKKVGSQALHYAQTGGMALARSKVLGTALAGVALAFPAVGAPALAAWGAANRAVSLYDQARQGIKTAQQAVKTVQRNAQLLHGNPAPAARLALAGLRSYGM
jgi:hypothetical protein